MTSPRRDPPRPSDHSPSCPAYSPSAKYADCTCGVTTPRKGKRPNVAEATEKALAADAAELEAERKSAEQREAMERLMMSSGTVEQQGAKRELVEKLGVTPVLADAMVGAREPVIAGAIAMQDASGQVEPADDVDPVGVILDDYDEVATADKRYLDRVGDVVSQMSQRLVSLVRIYGGGRVSLDKVQDHPVEIRQTCSTCREEHRTKIGDVGGELAMITAVGLAARKARIAHRCPMLSTYLPPMTQAELEQLANELERDGTEMVVRSMEVLRLAKLTDEQRQEHRLVGDLKRLAERA